MAPSSRYQPWLHHLGTSQGSIIEVPSLEKDFSTLPHLHPCRLDTNFWRTSANSKGPEGSPCCTPDSELIWPRGCHTRGWVPQHQDTQGSSSRKKKVANSSRTACLETILKALLMSTLSTTKSSSIQYSSMHPLISDGQPSLFFSRQSHSLPP